MGEDSLQTLELPPLDPSAPCRVFLEVSRKDGLYPMMPHSMYCLPLWPGINLVLITKVCFSPRIHRIHSSGFQSVSLAGFSSPECQQHHGHVGV